MAAQNDLPDVELDPKALYQEDVFTDRRAGSIRRGIHCFSIMQSMRFSDFS